MTTRKASEAIANAVAVAVATDSPDSTRALAARLATICRPGDIVLLVGGLGAGKTTFAQGFARGLGIEGPVTSPTFTLLRQYPCSNDAGIRQLLHADVYRLESMAEIIDLALPELVEEAGVALVEWGDVAAPALGDSALVVTIGAHLDAGRTAGSGQGIGSDDPDASAPEPSGELDDAESEEDDVLRHITVRPIGPGWEDRRDQLEDVLAGVGRRPT